ncbi:MAG: DUF3313 domain-containing protein [Gammaproteobacteria bacterium]|nr:DUF3313 domain-containing protein [Gammaproteobacteria bacterium]NNL50098.1 DUF3313 family protein [Woeseiaceae bacterium]
MSRYFKVVSMAAGVAVLLLSGCAQVPPKPSAMASDSYNFEGLEKVDARGLDIAFIRPGVKFSSYTGLLLDPPELAFRTPDRATKEIALTPTQKSMFRDSVEQHFQAELGTLESLKLVVEPGPDILRLKIRVQDISARVLPQSGGAGGWSNILLDAVGEATLVLELRDSESDEILARGVDARAIEGGGMRQKGGVIATKWSEVEELCKRWASIARQRLDALVEGG